jgi:predicted nucleic acid-binding protein
MRRVFADAFYFFALLSDKDERHGAAVEFTKTFSGRLVTTEWVMTELADGLASSKRRGMFLQTRQRLLSSPNYHVVPLQSALFEEGITLFDSRADKEWSLTDCISFIVMQREGITEALTGDHHFEQAGFTALFK